MAAGCGLVYAWLRSFGQRDVRRSQLARAAASYAGGDLEGALAALDGELGRPLYDSRQFTLTGSWLLGHVGSTRVPVAVPLGAVAGVYHHLMVRRIRTGRRNTHFFQVLISDKFGRELVLQLKDKKQLDQVYGLLVKACPHAENGSFEDYVLGFGQLPEEERAARIRTVMEKNAADGMSHCEP